MGDLPGLLLVVAVIYGLECLVWVRLGAVAFSRYWGRRWQLRQPGNVAGNRRGGFLLAQPFPPLGAFFIARQFPISVSPEAMFSYVSACLNPVGRPPQAGQFFRFRDVRVIRADGKTVVVNDAPFFRAGSHVRARHLSRLFRRLQESPEERRATLIRQTLLETLDTKAITEQLESFRKHARPLRVFANILFGYLFVLAPLWVWQYGFGHFGWALLIGLFAQTATIAVLFRRAHKAMLPLGDEERFTAFLIMLLAPPTAIRAQDLLARHLLENFHPLAAARVLCPPGTFKAFARAVLLDLRFPMLPICPDNETSPCATEQWFRTAWLGAVEEFISDAGLSPTDLTAAPAAMDQENRSYCPRCGAQFITIAGLCPDCGGRSLEPFLSAKPEPAISPVSEMG